MKSWTQMLSRRSVASGLILTSIMLAPVLTPGAWAEKGVWRQATDQELAALLPARAPVEKEHIETEARTATGITDGKGHYIAGIVLITAGYSADGKYSHYLVVQSPVLIAGIRLVPGEYVFGWQRDGDGLSVHLHEALSGKLLGTVEAHRMVGTTRVESLHIWPPSDRSSTQPVIQIGRFALPYELPEQ